MDPSSVSFLLEQLKKTIYCLKSEDKEYFFKSFIGMLAPEDMSIISYHIGKSLSCSVVKDAQSFSLLYKDVEALSNINLSGWMKAREPSVVSFVLGIGNFGKDVSTVQNEKELNYLYLVHWSSCT